VGKNSRPVNLPHSLPLGLLVRDPFEENCLPGWKAERHAGPGDEELIDRSARSGAGGKSVVVKDDEAAQGQAWPDEVQAVKDGFINIEIDMRERDS